MELALVDSVTRSIKTSRRLCLADIAHRLPVRVSQRFHGSHVFSHNESVQFSTVLSQWHLPTAECTVLPVCVSHRLFR